MKRQKVYEEKRYNFLIDVIWKNNYHVGAEIGCERGNTTRQLFQRFPNLRLYAVDLWGW